MDDVNLGPKARIERRRRHDAAEESATKPVVPLRRESDQVKARLQRWIDLADRALGGASGRERRSQTRH
jgi:hypothetical protein